MPVDYEKPLFTRQFAVGCYFQLYQPTILLYPDCNGRLFSEQNAYHVFPNILWFFKNNVEQLTQNNTQAISQFLSDLAYCVAYVENNISGSPLEKSAKNIFFMSLRLVQARCEKVVGLAMARVAPSDALKEVLNTIQPRMVRMTQERYVLSSLPNAVISQAHTIFAPSRNKTAFARMKAVEGDRIGSSLFLA